MYRAKGPGRVTNQTVPWKSGRATKKAAPVEEQPMQVAARPSQEPLAAAEKSSGQLGSSFDEDQEPPSRRRRLEYIGRGSSAYKFDVAEIFSPPRLCSRARERGLRGGWSLGAKRAYRPLLTALVGHFLPTWQSLAKGRALNAHGVRSNPHLGPSAFA